MDNNWFVHPGDRFVSDDFVDQKVGLAGISIVGGIAVACMELSAAKGIAKTEMHPFWKWATVAGLGANAAGIIKRCYDMLYAQKPDPVEEETDDESDQDETEVPDDSSEVEE